MKRIFLIASVFISLFSSGQYRPQEFRGYGFKTDRLFLTPSHLHFQDDTTGFKPLLFDVNTGRVQAGYWAVPSGGGSPANLALGTATTTTLPITNSNGTGFTIPSFSTTAGLVSGTTATGKFLRDDNSWQTPTSSPSITQNYIGYGSGSNLLTGSTNFTYNGSYVKLTSGFHWLSGTAPGYFMTNTSNTDLSWGAYVDGVGSYKLKLLTDGLSDIGDRFVVSQTGLIQTFNDLVFGANTYKLVLDGTGGNDYITQNGVANQISFFTGGTERNQWNNNGLKILGSGFVTLPHITAPSTPASGFSAIYVDVADGHVKQKDPSGVVFDLTLSGSSGTTTNAATFNNSGSGDASGTTFDGSTARTISYNTIGAAGLAANNTFSGSNTFSSNLLVNNSVVITGEFLTDTYLRAKAIATPSTPSAGYGIYYTNTSDNKPHFKNDAGTDYDLTATGGGTTTNALTFNNSGSGDASGSTFNGSAAKTLSYNSIGAMAAAKSVQTLSSQYADASNTSTTETDLLSYTLPANTLLNNGDRIVIEAMFTTPSNGDSKDLKFYFGSTTQEWTSSTIASGVTIKVKITIVKTGASSQRLMEEFFTGFTEIPGYTTSGQTDTGTITIKFAGTCAASTDITQRTMSVTYFPN